MRLLYPIDFIEALKASSQYAEIVYQQGDCYKFHLLLKKLYPDAEPYLTPECDHVVSLIDGKFYDITGEVLPCDHKMSDEDIAMAEFWSFEKHQVMSIGECPFCEEPLLI